MAPWGKCRLHGDARIEQAKSFLDVGIRLPLHWADLSEATSGVCMRRSGESSRAAWKGSPGFFGAFPPGSICRMHGRLTIGDDDSPSLVLGHTLDNSGATASFDPQSAMELFKVRERMRHATNEPCCCSPHSPTT